MLITQGSLVRAQLDPPRFHNDLEDSRGISSAGRAPALQAGGRRFDPVILHQDFESANVSRSNRPGFRFDLLAIIAVSFFNNLEEVKIIY